MHHARVRLVRLCAWYALRLNVEGYQARALKFEFWLRPPGVHHARVRLVRLCTWYALRFYVEGYQAGALKFGLAVRILTCGQGYGLPKQPTA